MPLFKCCDCHHEWEYSKAGKCDWCSSNKKPIVLEEKTNFEKAVKDILDFVKDLENKTLNNNGRYRRYH